MNKLAQITAITIASSAGLAAAGSLDLDRAYASELRSDAGAYSVLNSSASNLTVTAGFRFGYNANFRDNDSLGDDDTTIGFGFQTTEIRVSGQVTDSITATMSFGFNEYLYGINPFEDSDTAYLEDAYADWAINDTFTLRMGQFIQSFSAGRSIDDFHGTNVFRSGAEQEVGDVAFTQGVEAHFGGDTWSGVIGFNDGPDSDGADFADSSEADWAINARFDFFSDSDKARFDHRASWRGSSNAWRLGAGLIYATYGDTNPTPSATDDLWYTIDGAYQGDGWQVNAAFFGMSVDPDGGSSVDTTAFEIGGSMFFNDQTEGYARFDMIMFDDAVVGPEDNFSFLAGGVNYYLVPESHAARLTAELGYSFQDGIGNSGFDGETSAFLGDSDGEFTLSFMAQFMF